MAKLKYSGGTGKYGHLTLKQLKDILKENQIPGRSRMTRRIIIIDYLENLDRSAERIRSMTLQRILYFPN
jgi:hypothetical protein